MHSSVSCLKEISNNTMAEDEYNVARQTNGVPTSEDATMSFLYSQVPVKAASIGSGDWKPAEPGSTMHKSNETTTTCDNENGKPSGLISMSEVKTELPCAHDLRRPVSVGDTATIERLREFRRRQSVLMIKASPETRDPVWRGEKLQTFKCAHLSPVRLTRPIKLHEITAPRRRRSAFQAPALVDLTPEARIRRASTSLLPTRGLSAPIPIPYRDPVSICGTVSTSMSVSSSSSSSPLVSPSASGESTYFRLPKEMFIRRHSTSSTQSLREKLLERKSSSPNSSMCTRIYGTSDGSPILADVSSVEDAHRSDPTAGSYVMGRHRSIDVVHEEPAHSQLLNRPQINSVATTSPESGNLPLRSRSPINKLCPRKRYTQLSVLPNEINNREDGNLIITGSDNQYNHATDKALGFTVISAVNRPCTISETKEIANVPVTQREGLLPERKYHGTRTEGALRDNNLDSPGDVFLISQDTHFNTNVISARDQTHSSDVSKALSMGKIDCTNYMESTAPCHVSGTSVNNGTHILDHRKPYHAHVSAAANTTDYTQMDANGQSCPLQVAVQLPTRNANTSDRRSSSMLNLGSCSSAAMHSPMPPCNYSNENIQYIQLPADNSTPFWHTQSQLPNQDAITKSAFVQTPDRHSVAVVTESDRAQFKSTSSSLRGQVLESFVRKHTLNSIETAVVHVFQKKPPEVTIFFIQEHVRRLIESDLAPLLAEFLKYKLLKKGMVILREPLRVLDGMPLLAELAAQWQYFFTTILPWLHAAFLPLQSNEWKMRRVALVEFRDTILFKSKFEDAILTFGITSVTQMEQMLLVLQSIYDSFSPSRNDVRVERLLAQLMPPFLGKEQFYTGDERFTDESLPSLDEDVELPSPTSPVSSVRFGHVRNISLESARWIMVPGGDAGRGAGNQRVVGNHGRRHSFAVK